MIEQQQLIPLGVGERLRSERERRKISLEQAAAAIHVPVDVVDAIEHEALERYAAVYRRGYVRSYARFLGFDQAQIRELLTGQESGQPELMTVFGGNRRPSKANRWLKATSYVLASLLIGTLAWQFAHEAVRLTAGEQSRLAATTTGNDDTADSGTESVRSAHVQASIAEPAGRERPVASAGVAAEQAWSAIHDSGQTEAPVEALPPGEHVLNVAASADSWVEITDALGEQLEMDLVRGGSSKDYRGQAPFRILIGRASAIVLQVDGKPVDTKPYTAGDVTQMTLDPGAEDGEDNGNG